jgi:hypothetical protein
MFNGMKSRSDLVRKKQLLEVVPIGMRTLDAYIARRLVPYYKIGGVVMFDVDEVLEALKKFKRKAIDWQQLRTELKKA